MLSWLSFQHRSFDLDTTKVICHLYFKVAFFFLDRQFKSRLEVHQLLDSSIRSFTLNSLLTSSLSWPDDFFYVFKLFALLLQMPERLLLLLLSPSCMED